MSKPTSRPGSLVFQDTVISPVMRVASQPVLPPLFAVDHGPSLPGFTARDFVQLVFKHKWVVLLTIVVLSALAIGAALMQPTYYSASAQVTIKTDQQGGANSFLSAVALPREQYAIDPPNRRIETEMSALLSESNVEMVVRQFDLDPTVLKRSPMAVLQAWFKPYIKEILAYLPLPKKLKSQQPADEVGEAVKAFIKSASATPVRSKTSDVTSNVIEVSLAGTDPDQVVAALGRLIEIYVQRASERDLKLMRLAVSALTDQTADAATKLAQADDAVIKYSLRPGAAAVAGSQAARAGESINAKLRADIETLQAKLDVLRQTYGEQYVEVRTTRAALEQLRARQLEQSQDTTRSDATLGILERRRALAETRYAELQKKLDQVNLYMALGPTQLEGRVSLDMPRRSEKLSSLPKWGLLIGGPVASVLLAMALALALDLLDRRLQSRYSVARHLGLETLGSVPIMPKTPGYTPEPAAPSYFVPLATQDGGGESASISYFSSHVPNETKRA